MSEDANLQARIAALAGRINKSRQTPNTPAHSASRSSPYARWSPYSRGGVHKNRTLVVGSTDKKNVDAAPPSTSPENVKEPFISTRRKGAQQLMTKHTFDREQKQKQEYIGQLPPATKPQSPAQSVVPGPGKMITSQKRELLFDGVRFHLVDDGSKLIRIADPATAAQSTPKMVKIADVEFYRTKRGNLIRATTRKDDNRPVTAATKPQCEHFTKHGTCPYGPACKFAHNPEKVAICKEYLRSGSCPNGKACDLSHDTTYHRVTACTHFLRGNCTNSACRYPHVHVSPSAPVCRPFATLGYCPKGADCDKRHAFECPDYANHGRCANREKGSCPLPHIDHASALRKAAQRQAKIGSENESDLSSDDDHDSNNGDEGDDSELDLDYEMGGHADGVHALAQQQDFISLH